MYAANGILAHGLLTLLPAITPGLSIVLVGKKSERRFGAAIWRARREIKCAQIAALSAPCGPDDVRDDGLEAGRFSPLRTPGNRTGGEQDRQPVRVAHGRQGYRPARCRLSDAPGRAPEAEGRKPAQRGLDVDEERQLEEPGPRRRGRRPRRDVTVENIELQDTGVVVRNSRVAADPRSSASRGTCPGGDPPSVRTILISFPNGRGLLCSGRARRTQPGEDP